MLCCLVFSSNYLVHAAVWLLPSITDPLSCLVPSGFNWPKDSSAHLFFRSFLSPVLRLIHTTTSWSLQYLASSQLRAPACRPVQAEDAIHTETRANIDACLTDLPAVGQSAVFEATLTPEVSGNYDLVLAGMNARQLFVNGELLLGRWAAMGECSFVTWVHLEVRAQAMILFCPCLLSRERESG